MIQTNQCTLGSDQLNKLSKTVQQNCHIADAAHAGDYTLCIYLLKMREFYRWEQKAAFSTNLENKNVGSWLKQREALWNNLEKIEYQNIKLDNESLSPFESSSINQNLLQYKLIYSGGMGLNNRPHFFLAELERYEQHKEYTLYVAGKEYARDMSAPPAMSHDNNIYIRKESFRRLLWEKLETWRWNKPDNALGRAFACYNCDTDLDVALTQMTEDEVENVIQHERGEIKAGEILGDEWQDMLFSLPHSKSSIMLRAARDHLADSLTTLPYLLSKNSTASWHFYFGNLNNMRKDLYPTLIQGYEEWYNTGSLSKMSEVIYEGKQHWLNTCIQALQIHQSNTANQQSEIQKLIENNRL